MFSLITLELCHTVQAVLLRCKPRSLGVGEHTLINRRDDLASTFDANVVAVHNVTRFFMPLLLKGKGKKIFNMYV
jgi:hypothetical protein